MLQIILSSLAILTSFVPLSAATANNDEARTRWVSAMKLMETAQRAEDLSDNEVALAGFRDAVAEFQIVQQQNPQWNPALIAFRLEHCRKHVKKLEALTGLKNKPKGQKRDYERLYKILLSKAKPLNEAYLNQKVEIARLTKTLSEAQAESARLSARESKAEELAKQNHELTGKLAATERELRQATVDLVELKNAAGLEQELEKIRQEQQLAAIREADLQSERKRLQQETASLRRKMKQVSIERAEIANKLAEADNVQLSLTNRLKATRETLRQKEEDLTTAKQNEPAFRKQIAALESDLTNMRRLLSEQARKLNEASEIQPADKQLEAKQTAEIAGLHSELAKTRGEKNAIQTKLKQQESATLDLRRQLDRLQIANRDLRAQVDANKAAAPGEQRAYAQLQEKSVNLEAKNAALSAENASLIKRDKAQMGFVRALRGEVKQLKSDLNTSQEKFGELENKLAATTATTESEYNLRLESHRLAVSRLKKDLQKEQDKTRRLETQLLEKAVRNDTENASDEELKRTKKRLAELVTELALARAAQKENARQKPPPATVTIEPATPPTPIPPIAKPPPIAPPTVPATTLADRQLADTEAAIEMLLVRAEKAEQQGNAEAARWNYLEALKKDPQRQRALVRVGNILTDAGDFDAAERYLMRAFYNNPDDMELLMPLGFLLAHQGKADLAVSMLSRATALYPDNAEFHRYLGVACRSLGWQDAAEKQFLRSWKLDKKNAETAFNLAVLLVSATPSRTEEARKWYDTAIRLGSANDPQLDRLLTKP